jgi:hypothetical protein
MTPAMTGQTKTAGARPPIEKDVTAMHQPTQERRCIGMLGGLVLLLNLMATGCSRPVGQVTGQVFYNGQPLSSGTVTFKGAAGYKAHSAIGPQKTYFFDNVPVGVVSIAFESHDRVPSGFSTVKVPAHIPQPKSDVPVPAVTVPAKYKNPEESGLSHTVTPGEQIHDINLIP